MMTKISVKWLLIEFQATRPQTAKLHDPQRDSQERGIIRQEQVVITDTGMHIAGRLDGAASKRHLPTEWHPATKIVLQPADCSNYLRVHGEIRNKMNKVLLCLCLL